MLQKVQLQVSPADAVNEAVLQDLIRKECAIATEIPLSFRISRRSLDARNRNIKVNLSIEVAIDEPLPSSDFQPAYKNVAHSPEVLIIGAGPAGLFAALRCLEIGLKPVILERGKDVRSRRRDLAAINRLQVVNPESNYCFGEGGAGTYSDGKLYTRSSKRGDVYKILQTLVFHGASPEILVDAHPHIGTNKLPQVIEHIRETILAYGGEIHFETKLVDVIVHQQKVKAVRWENPGGSGERAASRLILATGHSARDIYELLHAKSIRVEAKPFAMGVRIEHPQALIDSIQYHCRSEEELSGARKYLPAASYALVEQVKGRGVYSFCMCPGGIIAPCATAQEEVVTNGWSPSKRNNPFANSGMVVGLELPDFAAFADKGPLAGLYLQKELERRAWLAGGKKQTAPAQRVVDFVNGKSSVDLPDCSYQPGIVPVPLMEVLGNDIGSRLREALAAFGKKMRGYLTNEAVLVGVESRTSTPVRIPRDKDTLMHPEVEGLFPCGEGAGFAGGIVSAAMDGERCAEACL